MNIKKSLYATVRLLVRETQPRNVSWAALLGLWWGFSPLGSLQTPILLVLSLMLRVNLIVLVLSAGLFTGVSFCLDPWTHELGLLILTKVSFLEPVFRKMQHAPILPYTGFNHTITLGLICGALVLSIPVYLGSALLFRRYRSFLSYRFRESRFFRRLKLTPLYHSYEDEKKAWGDNKSKYPSTLIRQEGLYPLALLILCALPYLFLFMDGQFSRMLERTATYYNRAPVKISKLRTHLFTCAVEFKDVKVGDPGNDSKNLFEIDQLRIDLLCAPLLRKKLVIQNLDIKGIRYGTQRVFTEGSTDGTSTGVQALNTVGLLDRVASGVFKQLGSQINDNPLRTIGVLTTGIDIPSRIEDYSKKSLSEKRLEELKAKVANARTAWTKEMDSLPSIDLAREAETKIREIAGQRHLASGGPPLSELQHVKEDLGIQVKSVGNFLERISRDLGAMTVELAQVEGLINEDIGALRKQLNLPKLEIADLSPALFGPPLLDYLERLVYWVDVSRRRLPTPAKTGKLAFTTRDTGRGMIVDYFKPSSYPSLVLVHGTIESNANESGSASGQGYGTVHGVIDNFSVEPVTSNRPARFFISADFPSIGLKDFTFEAIIDHRKEKATETIRMGVGKMPVQNFTLNEGGDASICIEKGLASLSAEFILQENELNGKFQGNFEDVIFKADSRFRTIEATLSDLLAPESRFRLEGNLKGPLDKLKLSTTTELGTRLATEIRNQFKHQLLAVDDELRKNLLDEVHPKRSEITSQVFDLKDKFFGPVQLHLQTLQEMTRYADTEIGRLEARKSPHLKKRG